MVLCEFMVIELNSVINDGHEKVAMLPFLYVNAQSMKDSS